VTCPPGEAADFGSLFRQWQSGDRSARSRLIEMNLGLVGAIVGRFVGAGEEREDLFQVGSIGLIKALDRFNPALGFNFSTYAFHTILGEVRRYLRDRGPVRVSRSLKERAARVRKVSALLSQQLGRDPTVREIAESIGSDESEVVSCLESTAGVVSLYEPASSTRDDPGYLLDRIGIPPKDVTEGVALTEAMEQLSSIERQVVERRYFHEMTQQDVAKDLGISQSQVSRIERRAIMKMREQLA